ncbi:EAL domain-containing protein [bacterium]|nr:EAL domain-containing protein [bacterium]MBU1435152.1 EAL domain-containing protein [bacterium]MBU1502809.1 EAL domain-containing protein [bacterium]
MAVNDLETIKEHTQNLKLLYIEENEASRTATLQIIKNFFNDIVVAASPQEALDLYAQDKQNSYDIVITAMEMQEVSGLDISKKIKALNNNQIVFISNATHNSKYFSDYIISILTQIMQQQTILNEYKNKKFTLEQKNEIIDEYVFTTTSDLNGKITGISQAYLDFTGYTKDEVLGKNHRIFRNHELSQIVIKNLWDTLSEDKIWKGELKNTKSSGEEYWISTIIKPLYNNKNVKIGYISIKEDITTKKRLEELSTKDQLTLLHNRKHFEYFIKKELNKAFSLQDTIALLTIEIDNYQEYKNKYGFSKSYKLLIDVSNLLKDVTQTHIHEIFKLSEAEFAIIISSQDDLFINDFANTLLSASETLKIKDTHNNVDDCFTLSIGAVNLNTANFNITCNDLYNIADANLSKAKKSGGNTIVSDVNEEYIKNLKNRDNITKLPNRSALVQDLSTLQEEAMLIILHMNQLNSLKELYGFEFVSNILIAKTAELQEVLDVKEATLYNLNLQEFAILVSDKSLFYKYFLILQHSILMAKDSYENALGTYFIADFTAGIAYGVQNIFNHADVVLQEAIVSKVNFKVYTNNQSAKQLQEDCLSRLKVYKNALHRGTIIPYFQPIVDAKNGTVVKYEALARLETEKGEIISPYYFLDSAKEDKTFEYFTRQIMQKVFHVFSQNSIPISMNLTYENINSESMVEYIKNRLEKYGGEGITFEILESEDILDYSKIASFIIMVKQYGCKISIDDFGSGYSNFTNILKLNIDYIKLDGSLIEKLNTDINIQHMIKGLILYAKNANIKTIAEFVSSKELADTVRELGIDYLQGYYYGEPKPPEHYGLL